MHEKKALYKLYDVSQAMTEFSTQLQGYRPKRLGGLRTIRHALYQFFSYNGMATGEDVDSWLAECSSHKRDILKEFDNFLKLKAKEPSISDNTLRSIRFCLLAFARKMVDDDADLPPVRHPELKRNPTPLTPEDIKKLLSLGSSRDRLMIMLAASTGIRLGGLSALTVNDVNEIFDRKEAPYLVTVRNEASKGGRGYISFFTEECAEALRNFISVKNLNKEDRLFRSPSVLQKSFHRLVAKSKIGGDRNFHLLRKFFRTSIAGQIPEVFVERLVGHTTGLQQIYTTPDVEMLRSFYAKAMPNLCFLSENGNARVKQLQDEIETLKNERDSILERLSGIEKTVITWQKTIGKSEDDKNSKV